MRHISAMLRANLGLIPGLALVVAIAGCEDPSNVGLGLIGESGGDPVRLHVDATELTADVSPLPTSNARSSLGFTSGAATVLFGTVEDPLFGTISAKGYVDVAPSSSQTSDYRSGTITSVELVLTRDYTYGDTLATSSVIISEMDTEWGTTIMSSDTVLTPGAEILTVDYSYGDSLFIAEFPEEWYSARSSVLLSADVVNEFDGFELKTEDPVTVFGFDAGSGFLHIITTTGEAYLLVSKIFTHIERGGDANVPPGRAIIQDGVGQNLSLGFDFQADSIRGGAISRAVIQLDVDREAMDQKPENFLRPTPQQFDLLGVRQDGSVALLRSAILGDDSVRFVSTTAAAGETTIVRVIQQAAAGSTEYAEYRVRISAVQAAINPILVYAPGADDHAPLAILTVTPNSF